MLAESDGEFTMPGTLLVASRQMNHLICDAVVAGTSMNEYAGSLSELPPSFIGEHRVQSVRG